MLPLRVADLTVDEFKNMLHQVVTETVVELFRDPDVGLDLREEVEANLRRSLAAVRAGVGQCAAPACFRSHRCFAAGSVLSKAEPPSLFVSSQVQAG